MATKTTDLKSTEIRLPPAVALPLMGRHLIEASAGTGKTWTLTGVVLRLIVEAGHPCDKIIATTFTRSAAAEMRERIRGRLQDFSRLVRVITQNKLIKDFNQTKNQEELLAIFWQALNTTIQQIGDKKLIEAVADPINEHLITLIANQIFVSTDKTTIARPTLNFGIALQRTTTALNQLDRLFVNTIDSLCQKWLREFSSETGYAEDVQISNDVKSIIMAMIHDQLRAFWARIFNEQPEIYRLMQSLDYLLKPIDFYRSVDKALNFFTAPIDEIHFDEVMKAIDIQMIMDMKDKIANYQNSEFDLYFDKAYRKKQGMDGRLGLATNFDKFKELQKAFLEIPSVTVAKNTSVIIKLIADYERYFSYLIEFYENDTGFLKDKSEGIEYLKSFTIIPLLIDFYQAIKNMVTSLSQLNQYFTQHIARYVREQLPKTLEAQRLTTFSLQLARLNQALQGRQGEALARYIRHQYPIALIDESQDVNTEQALLIQRIYLDKTIEKPSEKSDKTTQETVFLLLVGDPKQSIYGFRGGDVHNYTALKNQFDTQYKVKPIALLQNRRSSKALIDNLNQWYGVAQLSEEDNQNLEKHLDPTDSYFLGEQIPYRKIDASRKEIDLIQNTQGQKIEKLLANNQKNAANQIPIETQPTLCYLNIPYQFSLSNDEEDENYIDVADVVTAQILALVNDKDEKVWIAERDSNKQIEKIRPLALNDICILARKNDQLNEIEKKLKKAHIDTLRSGTYSVFADVMSADFQLLMVVLLNPFHLAKVKTLLMSKFFGLTLKQTNGILEEDSINENSLWTKINDLLVKTSHLWQKEGFLVAIQWFLTQKLDVPNHQNHTPQTFWQRLASDKDGERLLIDLRQLIDILAEKSQNQGIGEYQLFDWFSQQCQTQPVEDWSIQQRLPSENGVQLMTMHGSKGLEFPIVFVVGLDKDNNNNNNNSVKSQLYLYNNDKAQHSLLSRRMSAVQANENFDFQAVQQTGEMFESFRLMYVAMTRARERLYIVVASKKPASKKGKENVNKTTAPLKNFIEDDKSFELKECPNLAVTTIDINSLSKYINSTNQKAKQTSSQAMSMDYKKQSKAIVNKTYQGWSNTSFTALSHYISHDKLEVAIHQPDYDGLDDGLGDNNEAFNTENKTQFLSSSPQAQPQETKKSPSDSIIYPSNHEALQPHNPDIPAWHHQQFYDEIDEQIFDNENFYDNDIGDDFDIGFYNDDISYEPIQDFSDYDEIDFALPSEPIYDDFEQTMYHEPLTYPNLLEQPLTPLEDESELLRFNFERGASAGTFLHKVLEDLSNQSSGEQLIVNGLPPKRWAITIDRALRSQQLPSQYYSTVQASQGELLKLSDMDDSTYRATLQQSYIDLTKWLDDIIHTPFLASNQSPVHIPMSQKVAEMNFNMRLYDELSLKKINDLFEKEKITLNLQQDSNINSIWQYLRGEIDLVYQHNNKFHIVDYKSNFLGNTFASYEEGSLITAMNQHQYWLQAAIYQVALHRFLQLRLSDYDINKHLGPVEYAFIRGMSPNHDTGRLVWQPKAEFILQLDKLFGAK